MDNAQYLAPEELAVAYVRMPRELHDQLQDLARERRISLNELCVRALRGVLIDFEIAEEP